MKKLICSWVVVLLCVQIFGIDLVNEKVVNQTTTRLLQANLRDTNVRSLSNLVIFVRFADDEEITHPFADIDSMFNGKTPGFYSVYNYYRASTYGRVLYNTFYANQVFGNNIVSFVDAHPRGYYQPYSESNPLGYHGANPFIGISMREAELLAAAMDYVDSMHLVNEEVVLDGNGDGYIDNLSFIIKGGTGEWASLLWPHMEFFPQDSIDHVVSINGKLPHTFNFEFEGAGSSLFNANVFRHEMAHSLGIPDMYHYEHFDDVSIAGSWDMMCNTYVMNQTCMMNKINYLHVADEPIEITADGTYTLYSNATSPTQSCYYISSSIDPNQWFTFEYRNTNDLFDAGVPGTGLIAGRWNNNVPVSIYANAFFDNDSILHQYWIFRPGSHNDIENGNLYEAYFSAASGRTSFGPETDPHPYLADATPETSFEITEIQEYGDYLTFHVHFRNVGIEEPISSHNITLYPNPATQNITLTGENMQRVEVYNTLGQKFLSENLVDQNNKTMSVSDLADGIYFVRVIHTDDSVSMVKFVKQ